MDKQDACLNCTEIDSEPNVDPLASHLSRAENCPVDDLFSDGILANAAAQAQPGHLLRTRGRASLSGWLIWNSHNPPEIHDRGSGHTRSSVTNLRPLAQPQVVLLRQGAC